MTVIFDTARARTGLAFVPAQLLKPGFNPLDPACDGRLDAPEWLPSGGHTAWSSSSARLVLGETVREVLL